MTTDKLYYIPNEQIDKNKWDTCLSAASNGLIYGYAFYLDCMATSWDALILNDYEAVMPLPCRKKMGVNYLFQPPLTPALGVFGNNPDKDLIKQFLAAIPASFRLWDVSLNHSNQVDPGKYPVITRNNFVLPLSSSYENIQERYHDNIRRNIKRASKRGCQVRKNISIEAIIAISEKGFPKFTKVKKDLFDNLTKVYAHYKNQSETYGVTDEAGRLLSSCAFLISNNRAFYWLVGNTPESREYGASALLIDSFLRDHSGKNLSLDFEGSDESSVGDFYRKFGAQLESYTTIYYNQLPFPIRLLKPMPMQYRRLIS